ncbi:SDR family oxidoreductase [Microbacterium elymi]|uniref:SDR family NAD(P)-dependent oxidoreductase n=1 Tax=Microbacterium elymi TaxID=2909587 RepID=A0ABY5NIE9_9MICO|nr:SDR family NAD(P)-dependent oxidoreductase [Microbacterium elymi]UUT34871.1 SDR family NAD(P)-dependent oxidoreductase [Microbacterium elymi]
MMEHVDGKVAVITGGSSGIGRGIALACARAGMSVVVTGRSGEHLAATQALFAEHGLDVHAMAVDVTDLAAMRAAADEVQRLFGRVDVLVNNAGIGLTGPVTAAAPSDWDWVIDVNIKGVGNGIQAFLPKIRAHGEGGAVVNTASMAGLMPIVAGLYSMTKAAVIALSEALHIELLEEGISVAAYCPGPTHSNIASAVANRPERYGRSGYPVPPKTFTDAARDQPYMSAEEAGNGCWPASAAATCSSSPTRSSGPASPSGTPRSRRHSRTSRSIGPGRRRSRSSWPPRCTTPSTGSRRRPHRPHCAEEAASDGSFGRVHIHRIADVDALGAHAEQRREHLAHEVLGHETLGARVRAGVDADVRGLVVQFDRQVVVVGLEGLAELVETGLIDAHGVLPGMCVPDPPTVGRIRARRRKRSRPAEGRVHATRAIREKRTILPPGGMI